jgi:hypothetical protein
MYYTDKETRGMGYARFNGGGMDQSEGYRGVNGEKYN